MYLSLIFNSLYLCSSISFLESIAYFSLFYYLFSYFMYLQSIQFHGQNHIFFSEKRLDLVLEDHEFVGLYRFEVFYCFFVEIKELSYSFHCHILRFHIHFEIKEFFCKMFSEPDVGTIKLWIMGVPLWGSIDCSWFGL